MSLPWIKLYSRLPRHRKSAVLDTLLGRRRTWTHVVELWLWASEECPNGDLSGLPAKVIARAAGWTGAPDKFLDALRGAGFILGDCLNDWDEHQAAHVELAESRVASPADSDHPIDKLARRRAKAAERAARKRERDAAAKAERDASVTDGVTRDAEGVTERDDSLTERDASQSASVTGRDESAPQRARTKTEIENQRESQNSPPTPSPGVSASDSAPLLTPPPSKPVRQRRQRASKSDIVVPTGDTATVWQAYLEVAPKSALTADRAELIRRWLQPIGPYSVEQLVESIRGYRVSPFHNGENEDGTKHLGIELMLRNADKIENGWRYLAEHGASRPRRMPAEPSGRLPVYTPPVRPQEPVSEEDRRKAAEARQKLAKMTGGLADKVKPPDAPPPTRETLEARRAYLQEQARGLA